MEVSLIEKKGRPVQTKFKFTTSEWNWLPESVRNDLMSLAKNEIKISSRYITAILYGDYLNKNKGENKSDDR